MLGQLLDATHLIKHGPQLRLEKHALEPFYHIIRGRLCIGFKEKAGVFEPGPEHPLVSGGNHCHIFCSGIVDSNKTGQQLII